MHAAPISLVLIEHHRLAVMLNTPAPRRLPEGRRDAGHPRRDRQKPIRPRAADQRPSPHGPRLGLSPGWSYLRAPRLHHAPPACGQGGGHRSVPGRTDQRLRLPPLPATHLDRTSDNLSGVMYLRGHKQPANTGPLLRAAQTDVASDVLRPAAAATAAQIRSHSGHTAPPSPLPTPRRRNPEPSEMTRGLPAVRGRGLEPRWLLTASTSSGAGPSSVKNSAGLERQEASGSGTERRIPVT